MDKFDLNFESGKELAKIVDRSKNNMIYLSRLGDKKSLDSKTIKGTECPYCFKKFSRQDVNRRHVLNSCPFVKLRIIDDIQIGNREIVTEDQLIPFPRDFRECIWIAGPNGSGKSVFCRTYINEFIEVFPEKDIILFTTIPDDASFRDLDELNTNGEFGDRFIKIMVTDKLLDDPIDCKKELLNSLVIFDDIIKSSNSTALNRYMINLRTDILENGRDQSNEGNDIYVLCTNHLLTDYRNTRSAIAECSCLVLFPGSGSNISNILKNYCGLDRHQIEKIKHLPTRWVCIYKRYPMYCVYQHGIYLL